MQIWTCYSSFGILPWIIYILRAKSTDGISVPSETYWLWKEAHYLESSWPIWHHPGLGLYHTRKSALKRELPEVFNINVLEPPFNSGTVFYCWKKMQLMQLVIHCPPQIFSDIHLSNLYFTAFLLTYNQRVKEGL